MGWEHSASVLSVSTVPQSPPAAATCSSSSLMVKKALTEAAQHPAPLALHPASSAPDLFGPQLINTSSSGPSIRTISSHFSLMHSLVRLHLGHGPSRCWERGKELAKGVSLLSQDSMLTLKHQPLSLPETGLHLFLPQLLAHWTSTNLPPSALQLLHTHPLLPFLALSLVEA